jgi:hypothetical protein
MAYIYKSNGEVIETSPKNGKDFSLKELKEIVGGYIEIIDLDDAYMVINEEGKLLGLPFNLNATRIYQYFTKNGDYIVGDVLVCPKNQIL